MVYVPLVEPHNELAPVITPGVAIAPTEYEATKDSVDETRVTEILPPL